MIVCILSNVVVFNIVFRQNVRDVRMAEERDIQTLVFFDCEATGLSGRVAPDTELAGYPVSFFAGYPVSG